MALCRFLCDDPIVQRIPIAGTGDEESIVDVHAKDPLASIMGVPAGYSLSHLKTDRACLPESVRAELRLKESLHAKETGWAKKDQLMYTAFELHTRAKNVQKRWDDSIANDTPPLAEMNPEQRGKAWRSVVKQAKQTTN